MKKAKAIVLFSGGLDSILAVKILENAGVEVTALTFVSNFFGAKKAKESVVELGIKHLIVEFKDLHLDIVKKPKHGHGKNMNPCIDCHGLMLKKAKEFIDKGDYDFVATGEVLGQRPKSQNSRALKMVEKYADLENMVLRPLSAKLLDETIPEKKGLIDRTELLEISGRNRQTQFELAKKYKIKIYPSPAGGCILTDPGYSLKLKELLSNWSEASNEDVELLELGRIFFAGDKKEYLIVVGRNEDENIELEKNSKSGDFIFIPKDVFGPTVLMRTKKDFENFPNEIELVIPKENKGQRKLKEVKNEKELFINIADLLVQFINKKREEKVKILINKI